MGRHRQPAPTAEVVAASIKIIVMNSRCVTLLSLQRALADRLFEGGGTLNVSDLRAVFSAEIDKIANGYTD